MLPLLLRFTTLGQLVHAELPDPQPVRNSIQSAGTYCTRGPSLVGCRRSLHRTHLARPEYILRREEQARAFE